jgi:hypothetical protein
MAMIKVDRIAALWPTMLLITGSLIAGAVYSYSMFHSIIPTRVAISNVAMCRENAAPDDADPFFCLDASGSWKPVAYNGLPMYAAIAILMVSAAPLLTRSGFKKWAVSSLKGHLALWPLVFGIPMILLGLHLNFIEGTLTADWAAHVVLYGAIISTILAVPIWYFVTKPLMARRKKKQGT